MVIPQKWQTGAKELQVTKCEVIVGHRTLIEGTFNGAPFKPFVLPYDVEAIGFDRLRVYIEFSVSEQIFDALTAVA